LSLDFSAKKYLDISQPGHGTAREKFNEIKSPIRELFVEQSFFSCDLFRFWCLAYPMVRGSLVLGTFPELV